MSPCAPEGRINPKGPTSQDQRLWTPRFECGGRTRRLSSPWAARRDHLRLRFLFRDTELVRAPASHPRAPSPQPAGPREARPLPRRASRRLRRWGALEAQEAARSGPARGAADPAGPVPRGQPPGARPAPSPQRLRFSAARPRLRPASLRPGVAAASWNCPLALASGSPVPLPASSPTAFPPANGPSYRTPSAQIPAVTAPSGQTPRDTRTPPGSIQAAGPCKGLLRDAGAQRLLCQCPPCPSGKGPSSRSVHLLPNRQDVSSKNSAISSGTGLSASHAPPLFNLLKQPWGFFLEQPPSRMAF